MMFREKEGEEEGLPSSPDTLPEGSLTREHDVPTAKEAAALSRAPGLEASLACPLSVSGGPSFAVPLMAAAETLLPRHLLRVWGSPLLHRNPPGLRSTLRRKLSD